MVNWLVNPSEDKLSIVSRPKTYGEVRTNCVIGFDFDIQM